MMKSLLIPDNFDSYMFVGHMIQRSYDLSKTTLANNFENFVSVADVIVQNLNKLLEIKDL